MNTGWQTFQLDKVAEIIGGGTPKTSKQEYWGGDIPWLSVVDFNNDRRYVRTAEKKITEMGVKNSSTKLLQPGDTIISARGTVGVVAQIGYPMAFNQSCYGLRAFEHIVTPDFLYYLLTCASKELKQLANGGVFDTIIRETFSRIQVQLPPIKEQNSITEILNSFDNYIENLRDTNSTLEDISHAIFQSWFIDFDPVHAKAEGRAPEGMDAETAALFPDGFEASELGLVPKGWQVGKLEGLLELAYGKALKATDRVFGLVPVYGSGGITGYHNESLVNEPSIVVGRKGTVGSIYWEDQPFFPIDTVFYVKTKNPLTYCYYLLKTLGLDGMNTDGAVPGLNRNNAYRLPIVMAPRKVMDIFDRIVAPLRQKIFSNIEQAKTITTLRDILLPRLISGQLCLPEVNVRKDLL